MLELQFLTQTFHSCSSCHLHCCHQSWHHFALLLVQSAALMPSEALLPPLPLVELLLLHGVRMLLTACALIHQLPAPVLLPDVPLLLARLLSPATAALLPSLLPMLRCLRSRP